MVFDNVLTAEQCQAIVQKFEEDKTKFTGTCGGHQLRLDIKQTTDLYLRPDQGWAEELKLMSQAMLPKIMQYRDVYNQLETINMVHTGLQIQRSEVGQFYTTHIDDDTRDGYHRIVATLLYLSDVEEGGETHFTQHGVQVKPKAGRLVLFPSKWTHPHEAKKVLKGTKYIAVGWLQPAP